MTNLTKQILANLEYTSPEQIENSYDYWQAVSCVTDSVIYRINEALQCGDIEFDRDSIEEFINDSCLHETVDGCQYVIYSHYSLPIIQYSPNENYAMDNFGAEHIAHNLKEHGLSGLHTCLTFWALYADVQEKLSDILDDVDYDIECDEE